MRFLDQHSLKKRTDQRSGNNENNHVIFDPELIIVHDHEHEFVQHLPIAAPPNWIDFIFNNDDDFDLEDDEENEDIFDLEDDNEEEEEEWDNDDDWMVDDAIHHINVHNIQILFEEDWNEHANHNHEMHATNGNIRKGNRTRKEQRSTLENIRNQFRQSLTAIKGNEVHVDIREMLGLNCSMPQTMNTQLIVKLSTLQYYGNKLIGNYMFGEPVNDTNNILYQLCKAIDLMYKKQVMRNDNLSKQLIQRWINGGNLLHRRHAQRITLNMPERVWGISPDFTLLYNVLKATHPLCTYVAAYDAYNSGEYNMQMFDWVKQRISKTKENILSFCMKNLYQAMPPEIKTDARKEFSHLLHTHKDVLSDIVANSISKMPLIKGAVDLVSTAYITFINFFDGLKRMLHNLIPSVPVIIKGINFVLGVIGLYFMCKKLGELAKSAFITILNLVSKQEDVNFTEDMIMQMAPEDEYEMQISSSTIATGIVGILSYVWLGKFETKYAGEIATKLSLAKNFTGMATFFIENLTDIWKIVYSSYTGKPFFSDDITLARFEELAKQFMFISGESDIATYIKENPGVELKIIQLYRQMLEHDVVMRKVKATTVQQQRWGSMLAIMKMWFDYASSKQRQQVSRVEPIWINIEGPAGSGKSALVDHLIHHIKTEYCRQTNKPVTEFRASDRYERKIENEYWDGYEENFAVTIDDLFQQKAVELRMQLSQELIHMCNNTSFHLHMSDIKDKMGCYFKSRLIITTTNDTQWANLGIMDADAIYRRVTLSLVKPKMPFTSIPTSKFHIKTCAGPEGKLVVQQPDKYVIPQRRNDSVLIEDDEVVEKKIADGSLNTLFDFGTIVRSAVALMRKKDELAETLLKPTSVENIDHSSGLCFIPAPYKSGKNPEFVMQLTDHGTKWLDKFYPNTKVRDMLESMEESMTTSCIEHFQAFETTCIATTDTTAKTCNTAAEFWDVFNREYYIDNEGKSYLDDFAFSSQRHMKRITRIEPEYMWSLHNSVTKLTLMYHDKIAYALNTLPMNEYNEVTKEYKPNINLRYKIEYGHMVQKKIGLDEFLCDPLDLHAVLQAARYETDLLLGKKIGVEKLDEDYFGYKRALSLVPILTGISVSILGFYALWRHFQASDAVMESGDKGLKARDNRVYRTGHYNKATKAAMRVVLRDKKEQRSLRTKLNKPHIDKCKRNSQPSLLTRDKLHSKKEAKIREKKIDKILQKQSEKQRSKSKRERSYRPEGEMTDSDSDSEFEYSLSSDNDCEMQMSNHVANIANKIAQNTVTAYIDYEEVSRKCYLFFVKGTLAVTTAHYLDVGKIQGISLHKPSGSPGSHDFHVDRLEFRRCHDRDLVFINFPHECPSKKDLTHFLKPFKSGSVQENPSRIQCTDIMEGEYGVRTFIAGSPSQAYGPDCPPLTSSMKHDGRKITFSSRYYYSCPKLPGFAGACGLPYMDYSDPTTPLMGIHVAGLQEESIVCPIFRSDLENWNMQCSILDECHPLVKTALDSDLKNGVIHVYKNVEGVDMVCALERKHYIPSKTRILPSPFQKPIGDFEVMHPITQAPAKLSGDPSPLNIAMSKYGESQSPKIHPLIVKWMEDERIFDGCLSTKYLHAPRQELSLLQAIKGEPTLDIPSMDFQTGLGEPFTQLSLGVKDVMDLHKPPNDRCKKLGLDFWVADSFLDELERVEAEHENEDYLPNYPVNDTLKDETRDLKRVEDHKTRLFDAGPKTNMLYYKRKLGHLIAHIEKGRRYSDIAVGMNVHSIEWHFVAQKLCSFAKNGIEEDFNNVKVLCGDFGRWDKSMLLFFAYYIGKWMAKKMGSNRKQTRCIIRLVRAAFLAIHFSPYGIYRVRKGGTSGHYFTSIVNSIYNSVIHRLAFNFLCPEYVWRFDDFCKALFYGDDSIIAIAAAVENMYNMITLQQFFKTYLDMEYTSPTKENVLTNFMTLQDASFLKRRFVKVQMNDTLFVVAQLELDSIHNSIMWMNEHKTQIEEWEALCGTARSYLTEYFKYGEKLFERQRRHILQRMKILAKHYNQRAFHFENFQEHLEKFVLESPEQ